MAWVRLDDALGDDARIATAGPTGAGVLVLGLCYSNRNLTDGWVPAAVVRRLLADAGNGVAADVAIERLLASRLLVDSARDGLPGYQIHADYVQYQPTREQALKQRRGKSLQKAEAGRLGGIAKAVARRQQAASTPVADTRQSGSTSVAPDPDPDPQQEKSTAAVASAPAPTVREFEIATHAQLCKVYDEVLRHESNSSDADRKEAFRLLLADRRMKADPADPQALRKAMDVVEKGHSMTGGIGGRGGGFRQIAAPC